MAPLRDCRHPINTFFLLYRPSESEKASSSGANPDQYVVCPKLNTKPAEYLKLFWLEFAN